MTPRIEVVGIDSLVLRLFDQIDEDNMPWMLAATQRVRDAFGAALIDLVPSYTTLLVQYDLAQLDDHQARQYVRQALDGLEPAGATSARQHDIPVWYDPSVGPELQALGERSGLGVAGSSSDTARTSIKSSPSASHPASPFSGWSTSASPAHAWRRRASRCRPAVWA